MVDLEYLKKEKVLLAFSNGSDSNALFHLLIKNNINFDIVIVNYNTRDNSKLELDDAKTKALKHKLKCFDLSVKLEDKNFEAQARKIRYDFFEKIISENFYTTLLTAHHLNDRFEWFLMQLGKGAGVSELLGFEHTSLKDGYKLIRPLINTPKEQITAYLKKHNIKHFLDSSNTDLKYKRNSLRVNFSDQYVKEFSRGLIKSFKYLNEDKKELIKDVEINYIKELIYFKKSSNRSDIEHIDKEIKKLGYIISTDQREQLKKSSYIQVARKIDVLIDKDYIFIFPKTQANMDKNFKELCRIKKIPLKLRAFLYVNLDVKDKIFSFIYTHA